MSAGMSGQNLDPNYPNQHHLSLDPRQNNSNMMRPNNSNYSSNFSEGSISPEFPSLAGVNIQKKKYNTYANHNNNSKNNSNGNNNNLPNSHYTAVDDEELAYDPSYDLQTGGRGRGGMKKSTFQKMENNIGRSLNNFMDGNKNLRI